MTFKKLNFGVLVASEQKTEINIIRRTLQKCLCAKSLDLSLKGYLTIIQVSYYNPQ